jgi:drug/metabolite transporter (DMT)-like permease
MHADIPPLALSFWRWTLALAILCFFGVKRLLDQRELALKHRRYIIVQGLLGVTGFNTLIYLAMQTTTAINAVLVNSSIPVLIVIISRLRFGEKISLRQSCGVALSLCGVLFIISGGKPQSLIDLQFNLGDVYIFIAANCWAMYSVNLKKYPQGLHPHAFQSGIVLAGLLALLPLYLIELEMGKSMVITPATLLTIAYVAIFASILAFLFWTRAVTILGANIAGPFIHLMPVFSTLLAVIFLDERLTLVHLQAILMIFGGILLVTLRPQKRLL